MFDVDRRQTEVYASLEQQANALDIAEGAMGVPVPTTKVTNQRLEPMDTVISLLSDEARVELAKLRREYVITFARQVCVSV